MIKVEKKNKESNKKEQLQKMEQLMNRKDNEPEDLVEEGVIAVARTARHQQERHHIKHLILFVVSQWVDSTSLAK